MPPINFITRLNLKLVLLLFFTFFFGKIMSAQNFNASFFFGNNWSHLSLLDDGLNRSGLVLNLNLSYVEIERQRAWTMGMLYRESGLAPSFSLYPNKNQSGIKLQWIELPVSISFLDWTSKHKNEIQYYKMRYSIGISPARLLHVNFIDYLTPSPLSGDELKDSFRKYGLNWLIGASFFPHPNWSFNFQFSRSILSLMNTEKANTTELGKIRQSLLSVTIGFYL